MFSKAQSRRDPGMWTWVVGLLVLPALVLIGVGPGRDRALGPSPDVVPVTIQTNRIEMTDQVIPGEITLEVTNRDSVSHGLAVRPTAGGDPTGKLEAPLAPGAKATLALTLAEGNYRIYCPNAVDRGLSHVLRVRAPESGR